MDSLGLCKFILNLSEDILSNTLVFNFLEYFVNLGDILQLLRYYFESSGSRFAGRLSFCSLLLKFSQRRSELSGSLLVTENDSIANCTDFSCNIYVKVYFLSILMAFCFLTWKCAPHSLILSVLDSIILSRFWIFMGFDLFNARLLRHQVSSLRDCGSRVIKLFSVFVRT